MGPLLLLSKKLLPCHDSHANVVHQHRQNLSPTLMLCIGCSLCSCPVSFIKLILDALIYTLQYTLCSDIITYTLPDLLIHMPGIWGALVRPNPHEGPANVLPSPAALNDLPVQVANMLPTWKMKLGACKRKSANQFMLLRELDAGLLAGAY